MSSGLQIEATSRAVKGTGASRRLRRAEQVPAILYGAGDEPLPLTIEHRLLRKALENSAFYSSILTVNVDGKPVQAVLKALQRHPYKPKILHVDLLRVSATQKITMRVPLRFVGADAAPGVKLGGGIVSHLLTDVEVACRAGDLPEAIEVDLSALEVDQSLHLSDLKLADGVELVALAQGNEHDLPVASIHVPRGSAQSDDSAAKADDDAAASESKPEGGSE